MRWWLRKPLLEPVFCGLLRWVRVAEALGCCWALLAAEELPGAEHPARGSPAAQLWRLRSQFEPKLLLGAHKATVNRRREKNKKKEEKANSNVVLFPSAPGLLLVSLCMAHTAP